MSTAVQHEMTIEEFLSLPDDGTDRELIRGVLIEKPMTYRNRVHSEALSEVIRRLGNWAVESSQVRRHRVLSGEAGFLLRRTPNTIVGIDVAVVAPEVMARQTDDTSLIDGAPLLAVEILSPSDTLQEIHTKTQLYLAAGVLVVWIIDPYDRTVQVYRPGQPPVLFNEQQQLCGAPELPGFEVAVNELFSPR
jgi:Uma2 family endonuclease